MVRGVVGWGVQARRVCAVSFTAELRGVNLGTCSPITRTDWVHGDLPTVRNGGQKTKTEPTTKISVVSFVQFRPVAQFLSSSLAAHMHARAHTPHPTHPGTDGQGKVRCASTLHRWHELAEAPCTCAARHGTARRDRGRPAFTSRVRHSCTDEAPLLAPGIQADERGSSYVYMHVLHRATCTRMCCVYRAGT